MGEVFARTERLAWLGVVLSWVEAATGLYSQYWEELSGVPLYLLEDRVLMKLDLVVPNSRFQIPDT